MDLKGQITPSRIVLGVLIAGVLAAMIFSGRPWRGYSAYQIREIRTLPDDPRLASVRRYTQIALYPYVGGEARPELSIGRQPVRLGWAYQEYGILGMPYWAQSDQGLVVYMEAPDGLQFGPVTPGQIPVLEAAGAGQIPRDYSFPWYFHIWGWLFPPAFLLWLWLWRREDRAREEAHWAE
jgi:hypothetical protein